MILAENLGLFFPEKSEVFSAFKSFKAYVENKVGQTVKAVPTDHGREFCSKEAKAFCDEQGIQKQISTSYTPQQNCVLKRKNRTILNIV